MKKQSIKAAISKYGVLLVALVVPVLSNGQPTSPPPPGPGGNGGNPDNPLGGVPFDTNMTLAFFALSVVFAVVIMKKLQKRKQQQLSTVNIH